MILEFCILGKPQGKARPKFARRGKFVTTYTPDATINYEAWVKQSFINKYKDFTPLETPLKLELNAYFSKAKSNKMKLPMIKPDVDNIIKIIADSLNGIAYKDDKQIISVKASKVWADIDIEGVYVYIEEIEEI